MSNYVRRWVMTDPYDTNSATNTYHFPRNPREMTSLHAERAVSSMSTTNHKILLYEGQTPAKAWQFSGPILDKQQFTDLTAWVYDRRRRVVIVDHYTRSINCVLTTFEVVPKRRTGYYYSHEYVVSALVLSVSAPAMGNDGPTS
jgi:hypothetical protein